MVQLLMDDFKVLTLFPAFCFDILIIWLLIHSLVVLYSVRNSVFLCFLVGVLVCLLFSIRVFVGSLFCEIRIFDGSFVIFQLLVHMRCSHL